MNAQQIDNAAMTEAEYDVLREDLDAARERLGLAVSDFFNDTAHGERVLIGNLYHCLRLVQECERRLPISVCCKCGEEFWGVGSHCGPCERSMPLDVDFKNTPEIPFSEWEELGRRALEWYNSTDGASVSARNPAGLAFIAQADHTNKINGRN